MNFPSKILRETLFTIIDRCCQNGTFCSPFTVIFDVYKMTNLQLWPFAIKQLLNKPYENEDTLRKQKLS